MIGQSSSNSFGAMVVPCGDKTHSESEHSCNQCGGFRYEGNGGTEVPGGVENVDSFSWLDPVPSVMG